MPCYDAQGDPRVIQETADRKQRELIERNNELARLLCGLCRRIEAYDQSMMDDSAIPEIAPTLIQEDPQLAKWWEEHQIEDEARANRDKIRFPNGKPKFMP